MLSEFFGKKISADNGNDVFEKVRKGGDGKRVPNRSIADDGKPYRAEEMTEQKSGGGRQNDSRDVFRFPHKPAEQNHQNKTEYIAAGHADKCTDGAFQSGKDRRSDRAERDIYEDGGRSVPRSEKIGAKRYTEGLQRKGNIPRRGNGDLSEHGKNRRHHRGLNDFQDIMSAHICYVPFFELSLIFYQQILKKSRAKNNRRKPKKILTKRICRDTMFSATAARIREGL